MTITKKCYKVFDIKYPQHSQEIYAESAGKAKSVFLSTDPERYCLSFTTIRSNRIKSEDIVQVGDKTGKRIDFAYSIAWGKWRSDIEDFGQENAGKRCYIYSGQWQSYWRSNAGGYTTHKHEAGVYEALDAVSRIWHCGLEKKIQLILITNN